MNKEILKTLKLLIKDRYVLRRVKLIFKGVQGVDKDSLLDILKSLSMDEIEAFDVTYKDGEDSYNFSYEKNLKVQGMEKYNIENKSDIKLHNIVYCITSPITYEMERLLLLEDMPDCNYNEFVLVERLPLQLL